MAILAGYVPAFCVYFLVQRVFKFPAAIWLFVGQMLTFLKEGGETTVPKPAAGTQSKRQKKNQQQQLEKTKRLQDGGQDDPLECRTILFESVSVLYRAWPFGDELEVTVLLYLVAAATFIWHVIHTVLGGSGFPRFLLSLTVYLTVHCLFTLFKVDMGGDVQQPLRERWHLLLFGLAGSAGTFYLLMLGNSRIIDFKLEAAAADLDKFLKQFIKLTLQQRMGGAMNTLGSLGIDLTGAGIDTGSISGGNGDDGDDDASERMDPAVLATVMSGLAGVIAALMAACGRRVAQMIHNATLPPYWIAYFVPRKSSIWVMQLSVVAATAVTLCQIRPITSHLGIGVTQIDAVWMPALLGFTAVCMALAARPLVGMYFTLGLVQYCTVKHQNAPSERRSKLISAHFRVIYAMTCKAAVQFVTPALLLSVLWMVLVSTNGTLNRLPRYHYLAPINATGSNATSAATLAANTFASRLLQQAITPTPVATPEPTSATSLDDPTATTSSSSGTVADSPSSTDITGGTGGTDATDDPIAGLEGLDGDDSDTLPDQDAKDTKGSGGKRNKKKDRRARQRSRSGLHQPSLDLKTALLRSLHGMLSSSVAVPNALLSFGATYLAWFTCAAWSAYVWFMLFVYRWGMHLG